MVTTFTYINCCFGLCQIHCGLAIRLAASLLGIMLTVTGACRAADPTTQADPARAIHDRAVELLDGGDATGAMDIIIPAIAEHVSEPSPWLIRAYSLILHAKNLDTDPFSNLPKAIQEQMPDGPRHLLESYQYYNSGNMVLALDHIKESIRTSYSSPLQINLAAAIYGQLGHLSEAKEFAERALDLDPALKLAENNLFDLQQKLLMEIIATQPPKALRSSRHSKNTMQLAKRITSRHLPIDKVELFYYPSALGRGEHLIAIVVAANQEAVLFLRRTKVDRRFELINREVSGVYEQGTWYSSGVGRDQVLLVIREETSGPHHYNARLFYWTSRDRTGTIDHEWQSGNPIRVSDINYDGTPEILLDLTDYYVQCYADGIQRFDYEVLFYDSRSDAFVSSAFLLSGPSAPDPQSAELVAQVMYGRWADILGQKAVQHHQAGSQTSSLDQAVARWIAEQFSSQYTASPNQVTAILFGLRKPIDWSIFPEEVSESVLIDLGLGLIQSEMPDIALPFLRRMYRSGTDLSTHVRGSTFANKAVSGQQQEVVYPTVRAMESGLIALATNQLNYIPFGTKPAAVLSALDGSLRSDDASPFFRLQQPPSSDFRLEMRPSSDSTAFAYRKMENLDNPASATELSMTIADALRRRDYDRVRELINILSARFPDDDDGDIASTTSWAKLRIDLERERYYEVVSVLANYHESGDWKTASPRNSLLLPLYKAYENVGVLDVPTTAYKAALVNLDESLSAGNTGYFHLIDGYTASLGLGRIAMRKGNFAEARIHFLIALELLQQREHILSWDPAFTELLRNLASAELSLGELPSAHAHAAMALRSAGRIDQGSGSIQSARGFDIKEIAEALFIEYRIARAQGRQRLAVAYLSAALSIMRDLYLLSPRYLDQLGVSELSHEMFREAVRLSIERGDIRQAWRILDSVKNTTALRRRMQADRPSESMGLRFGFEDAELEQALKHSGTTLVEYVVEQDHIGIFIRRPGKELQFVRRDIEKARLQDLADRLLDTLLEPRTADDQSQLTAISRNLHDLLISPLLTLIPRDATVTVIPDGIIFAIPLAILVDQSGEHAIEKFSIAYNESVSTFIAQELAPTPPHYDALVMHSPLTRNAAALPFSAAEAGTIEAALSRVHGEEYQVLIGESLTVDQTVAAITNKTLVHFATHSVADQLFPQDSALLLSDTTEHRESISVARLLAGEIPLKGLPLVFLSSCQSGVGKVFEEGVLSLASGFLISGARTVVVTRWEIEDKSTTGLVGGFYRALFAGKTPSRALQSVQIRSIRAGLDPRIWGAFAVYGKVGK